MFRRQRSRAAVCADALKPSPWWSMSRERINGKKSSVKGLCLFGKNTHWRTRVGQIWDSVGTWRSRWGFSHNLPPSPSARQSSHARCLFCPTLQARELLTFASPRTPTPAGSYAWSWSPMRLGGNSLRCLCWSWLFHCPSSHSSGTSLPLQEKHTGHCCQNFPPCSPSFFFPSLFCRSSPLCTVCYVRCGSTVPEKTHTITHTYTHTHVCTHTQSQTHSWAPAAHKDRGLEINEGERRKGERSLNKLALEKRRKMRTRDWGKHGQSSLLT